MTDTTWKSPGQRLFEGWAEKFHGSNAGTWDGLAAVQREDWDALAMSLYPTLRNYYVNASMERDELKDRLEQLGDDFAASEDQRAALCALVYEILVEFEPLNEAGSHRLADWRERAAAVLESDPLS